jgi:hypothetical protein
LAQQSAAVFQPRHRLERHGGQRFPVLVVLGVGDPDDARELRGLPQRLLHAAGELEDRAPEGFIVAWSLLAAERRLMGKPLPFAIHGGHGASSAICTLWRRRQLII